MKCPRIKFGRIINGGSACGTLIGANLCTLNLLQGAEYFPDLNNSILFLEDDEDTRAVLFERDLQSLIHQPGFSGVNGLVIGRFQQESGVSRDILTKIIKTKKELDNIPVIANIDFGHTQSMITFPIGGEVSLSVDGEVTKIEMLKH